MSLINQSKKFCGLLLIAICALMSCGCSSDKEADLLPGSIYGLAIDAETAEPMRGTEVELYKSDSGALLLKTVTYDDGHFEFKDLQPGYYKLVVNAEGYEKEKYGVEVETARIARADMQLKKLETYMTVTTVRTDARSNGTVSFYGLQDCQYYGYDCTECGFIYGQNSNLTVENGTIVKTQIINKTNGYNMTTEVKGLTTGKWYVMAYAKNKVGIALGNVLSFEISGNPEVLTLDIKNITESTATLNGRIVYEGDPKYTEKGFVYSSSFPSPTVDDPESATSKVIVNGSGKDFSANISNLTKDKTYYVRAYATGSTETVYGAAISFVATSYIPYIIIDNIAVQLSDLSNGTNLASAKDICSQSRVGGFSDWRLPTLGELSLIYANKDKIKGFADDLYWSSTFSCSLVTGDYYFALDFGTGKTSDPRKDAFCRVRAVRTITDK